MQSWTDLEHKFLGRIKQFGLLRQQFAICVSGGMDSVVLATICRKVLKPEQMSLFHFHHGDFENKIFRDKAQRLVVDLGKNYGLPVRVVKADTHLKSEQDCRRARLRALQAWNQESKSPRVFVWGHHSQDLLETRLIRLLRGTGPLGLQAMSEWKNPHLRPLLHTSQGELRNYAQAHGLFSLEDPSNQESRFLRNWLRNKWLPALNSRHSGGVHRLAESLELMAQSLQKTKSEAELGLTLSPEGLPVIELCVFLTLSHSEKSRGLALFLFYGGSREFRQTHIQEILRQLDNGQKEHIIRVAGLQLRVNAGRIQL